MAVDGSYIPAEVSRNSWIDVEVEVEQSMLSYLEDLDQELASQPGFEKPPSRTVTKKVTTSITDPECDTGAVHRGLEQLGITGYIPAICFPNDPSKYGFSYNPQQDTFICAMVQSLVYHCLNCNKSTGKYIRCY